jgi:Na+/phosphate symporter
MVLFFLYFFLFGLDLLGSAAKVLGGCTAGALFGDETNPVAGLMIGILATVLIQSSSSTTSIVVSLVGAGTVSVRSGIFMVMGSNIGTSVTNTIVALGHLGDGDELERAFAGATVHDMFNFLSVGILFPLELITHYLQAFSKALVPDDRDGQGEKWEGPIKKIVSPLGEKVIKANKDVTKYIAQGKATCENGDKFYPVNCVGGVISKKTCVPSKNVDYSGLSADQIPKVGLITCGDGGCPAFFQNEATRKDDEISGGVTFFLGLFILIVCLIGLVTILQKILMGVSTRIIYKATNVNGYLAILIGAAITILVQSSSITTSALTPFVGLGALHLEQMFPLTLGANIGTTITGILSAMVSDGVDALQVAYCHTLFNITGIIIWYPVPFMRRVPLRMARTVGKGTRIWRGFPVLYIFVTFFIIPLLLLGLSSLFEQDSKGFTVLGSVLVVILVLIIFWFMYKWFKGGLRESITESFTRRQRRYVANQNLPDDMDMIKAELARLREHTGLLEAEETVEDAVEETVEDAADDTVEGAAEDTVEDAVEDAVLLKVGNNSA